MYCKGGVIAEFTGVNEFSQNNKEIKESIDKVFYFEAEKPGLSKNEIGIIYQTFTATMILLLRRTSFIVQNCDHQSANSPYSYRLSFD